MRECRNGLTAAAGARKGWTTARDGRPTAEGRRRRRGCSRTNAIRTFAAGSDGYTFGMKTAISIPDDLFRRADELASQLGKSRSELYREALADYVARRDPKAVTSALNEIADELAADRDRFGDEAARRLLERNEW
jgi:predicted transcriptional regulator